MSLIIYLNSSQWLFLTGPLSIPTITILSREHLILDQLLLTMETIYLSANLGGQFMVVDVC